MLLACMQQRFMTALARLVLQQMRQQQALQWVRLCHATPPAPQTLQDLSLCVVVRKGSVPTADRTT